MGKKDKAYMPSGMGGLIRYGEEGKALFKIKPMQLVYIVGAVTAFELLAKFFFG